MVCNTGHELAALLDSGNAQAGVHPLCGQFPGGCGGTLVQKAQGVPKAAVCQSGQNPGGRGLQGNILLKSHVLQSCRNIILADSPEGKPLAPGQNGSRNLMQLRGSQNEQQVLRRLLNDFQQRIEGGQGKHVHLVDDIHPHLHL